MPEAEIDCLVDGKEMKRKRKMDVHIVRGMERVKERERGRKRDREG